MTPARALIMGVLIASSAARAASGAVVFADDFERDGGFTNWTSTSVNGMNALTIDLNGGSHGASSMYAEFAGKPNQQNAYAELVLDAGIDPAYARVFLSVPSGVVSLMGAGTEQRFLRLGSSAATNSDLVSVYLHKDTNTGVPFVRIDLRDGSGAITQYGSASTTAIDAGWQYVEVGYDRANSKFSVQLGAQPLTFSTAPLYPDPVTTLRLGVVAAANMQTGAVYYDLDDLVLATGPIGAGPFDGGGFLVMDGGSDGGVLDGGMPPQDAGIDAGSTSDAGAADAGDDAGASGSDAGDDAGATPDSGVSSNDGGTSDDAGASAATDAGAGDDAGSDDDAGVALTPLELAVGCGCASGSGGGAVCSLALLALLGGAVTARIRKTRR